MTKKDFILIAATIIDLKLSKKDHAMVVDAFVNMLREQNPRFKEDVFRKACGE